MNRIYEKLKDDDFFKDRLDFDETRNCLTVVFHEYLRLEYFEANYTSASDEGIIYFSHAIFNNTGHQHVYADEEVLETLSDLAKGSEVFLVDTSKHSLAKVKVMTREGFAQKKDRYLAKKSLRIYSGNSIIKRETL